MHQTHRIERAEVAFFFGEIVLRVVTEEGDDMRFPLSVQTAQAIAKGAKSAVSSATKGEPG